MSRQNRTQLVLGILLVLLGVWFVAVRQVPVLQPFANLNWDWPFYVIAGGFALLLIGLVTDAPLMAIPAALVAGIGGILYYQNISHDWESWDFMWTLIPGFVGVGTILAGVFGDGFRNNFVRGLNLVVLSAVLFLVFAVIFNRIGILGTYGVAVVLILVGLYIIGRGLIRPRAGG